MNPLVALASFDREEKSRQAERAHLRADELHDQAEMAHREGDAAKADRLLKQAAGARLDAEALDAEVDAMGA